MTHDRLHDGYGWSEVAMDNYYYLLCIGVIIIQVYLFISSLLLKSRQSECTSLE